MNMFETHLLTFNDNNDNNDSHNQLGRIKYAFQLFGFGNMFCLSICLFQRLCWYPRFKSSSPEVSSCTGYENLHGFLGGGFKYCFIFNPTWGYDENLTSIFFRWVGSTTNLFFVETKPEAGLSSLGKLHLSNFNAQELELFSGAWVSWLRCVGGSPVL